MMVAQKAARSSGGLTTGVGERLRGRERRGLCASGEEIGEWGERRGRSGDDGRFKPGARRWMTTGGVAPCGRRGPRERERGVPARSTDGAQPVGAGDVARPCRAAG
jgi:hypothetical protein